MVAEEVRPWLLVHTTCEQNVDDTEVLTLFDRLVRTLIQERDSLLTDTLAEELQGGVKIFLVDVVAKSGEPRFNEFFGNNSQDISTLEMCGNFVDEIESEKDGYSDRQSDRNVQNKGKPRKGEPGKRVDKPKNKKKCTNHNRRY